MLKNIVIATQDINLQTLCATIPSNDHIHITRCVDDLLSRASVLNEGIAVFVDVEWPDNHSGYEVARAVKRRHDGSKVFLLTDHINLGHQQWSERIGAQVLERSEQVFMEKLASVATEAGIIINMLQSSASLNITAIPKSEERTPLPPSINTSTILDQIRSDIESILGPMGSILLDDAMSESNGNIFSALNRVANFGTTASERTQISNISQKYSLDGEKT